MHRWTDRRSTQLDLNELPSPNTWLEGKHLSRHIYLRCLYLPYLRMHPAVSELLVYCLLLCPKEIENRIDLTRLDMRGISC